MNDSKLTIKGGKFFLGEERIKPEFGNSEHIALIQSIEGIQNGDLRQASEIENQYQLFEDLSK
ncbi:MAG TPA: hypothetical protein VGE26_09175 [Sphingobacteriaceae bacterium]